MGSGPANIGFIDCSFHRSHANDGSIYGHRHKETSQRRGVLVNGKKITTVDIHAHCAVPDALAILGYSAENTKLLMSDTS